MAPALERMAVSQYRFTCFENDLLGFGGPRAECISQYHEQLGCTISSSPV